MRRGVVLELREGRAVVLDASGGFRDVEAHPSWHRGDVVPLAVPRRRAGKGTLLLAACLLLALLGTGTWLWFPETALVSLDINPSVELSLNRFGRVVGCVGLNPEGEALLSGRPLWGKRCGDAVDSLLERRDLSSPLAGGAEVVLTVQAERGQADLLAQLGQAASAAGVSAECHGVNPALVEEAHSHGVTAGKYLALLELQSVDPQVDLDSFTHCTIGEIRDETARCQSGCGGAAPSDNSDGTAPQEQLPAQTQAQQPSHHRARHHGGCS